MMPAAPLLLAAACLHAAGPAPPALLEPADGARLWMALPGFAWTPAAAGDPAAMPGYVIQIATDAAFRGVADKDALPAVICHYVPDRPMPPGAYHWRVACVDAAGRRGPWSPARRLSIRAPRAFGVPAGATFGDIREVVAGAAAAAPARVVFDRGTYRLHVDEPRPLIELADAADVTIDGNGATVIFDSPAPMARFTNCRRTLLSGLTFDIHPPAYTAGRVVAVNSAAGTADADILPDHRLPDAHRRFAEDRKGMVVCETEGFAIKRGVRLVVAHDGFERLGGRRFRFRFADAEALGQLARGDIYVLDPRWQRDAGGAPLTVRGGEQVVLYDLTIFSAANECLSSFYADRHAILHVRLRRKPGRALSVNNGGNNHHNARRGPWIEGCLFENTGDDICHVNGYAMSIAAQPAGDVILVPIRTPYDQFCREAALDFRSGDRLLFYHRAAGRLLGERRVRTVEQEGKLLRVTLNRPIEGVTPGPIRPARKGPAAAGNAGITRLFNASRSCCQFVFRDNVARRGRRIGVLAKGDGGWIEGNVFQALGGGGVEFWNAPFEGPGAENYVVRGNRIVRCLRLRRTHAGIWSITFRPGHARLHRNLLIEANEIVAPLGPAVDLGDAENVVFRGNRVVDPPAEASGEDPVRFRNVGGLLREGNAIRRTGGR